MFEVTVLGCAAAVPSKERNLAGIAVRRDGDVFLLGMMQKVCFGPLNLKWTDLPDMTAREIFIGAVLMLFMFGIGIYPAFLTRVSNDAVVGLIKTVTGVLP